MSTARQVLSACLFWLLAAPLARAAEASLLGGGATFPFPIYSKWFDSFHARKPEYSIGYEAIGSEMGIRRLVEGKLDFAASDMQLTDAELSRLQFRVIHFPTVLGAVVPIYNVPGVVQELRFTPEALAGIYLGKIKRWNDPAIKAANHGVALADHEIVTVHRADGSGTSFVWTEYLCKISPDWKATIGAGAAVSWPGGVAAKGNEGVARTVHETPYSIGYVEFIYSLENRLSYGFVRNAAGRFVQADLETMTEAAAGSAAGMTDDFRVSITNAPGARAYPITAFTYLLVPAKIVDAGKREAVRELLRWLLTSGQRQCPALGYGALPAEIVTRAQGAIGRIE